MRKRSMGIALAGLIAASLMVVDSGEVLAGNPHRIELDHVGAYNFRVEISGVNAGYFEGVHFVQTMGLSETLQPAGKGEYVLRRTPRKKGQTVELIGLLEQDTPAVRKGMQDLKGRSELTISVDLVNLKDTKVHPKGTVCGWRMVKASVSDVRFEKQGEGKTLAILEIQPKRVQSACRQLAS